VVNSTEEAELVEKKDKLGVVAQTTQPHWKFDEIVKVLKGKGNVVEAYNTICHATYERQQAALELAKKSDVMIVVGGRESANTKKLTELCRSEGTPTYQVETAAQIKPEWFKNVRIAGVTAGASTPDWIIEEVERRMKELEEINGSEEEMDGSEEETNTLEEEVNASEEEVDTSEEEMQEAVQAEPLRHGDIVKGVVVHVGEDEVLVDVGAKSEGVIPLRELSCYQVDSPQELIQQGDEIEVFVIKTEDNEGRPLLSKERADAEKAWDVLEDVLQSGEAIDGTVREVVKGGVLVDVGIKAFLPASLVERGYVEDLSKYLGEKIQARVIELSKPKKKIILSRKAVLDEEYELNKEKLLASLEEGQVVHGEVRRLTNFGAFVDIGGVDGLLHISEMAWYRVNHPSEVLKVGEEIDVMVIKVDKEAERISLGRKQILPSPWEDVEERYEVDEIITAKVVRLAPFGAFVELEPGVEGLVHISHLSDRHVGHPSEVVSEGEEINVKVLSVDSKEKRMRLSIREVEKEKVQKQVAKDVSDHEYQTKTQDSGDLTLGDVFGDLLKNQKKVAEQQQREREQDEARQGTEETEEE
ncbi:MAG TPA: bifunctional 4-hydroxy-3-methylbut-2-enyl diphosphate reductase/30S ribosomal protein S1, partial [Clostridia bacterium]|nr:bifunctional 4-hydroxy-3-methylbut-2-enyl diphosphate reductase/30S ribosomal protein S1 [Clostridia bacterium]